jgi:hypothetical protein
LSITDSQHNNPDLSEIAAALEKSFDPKERKRYDRTRAEQFSQDVTNMFAST